MAVVEALISGRADLSKIYELREVADSSKRVTSSKISEEGTSLPQALIQDVSSRTEEHEQYGNGQVAAMATDFAGLDTHFSDRSRDDISSSLTADDQSTGGSTTQPHAIPHSCEEVHEPGLIDHAPTAMTPEVRSPPSVVDSLPSSDVDPSNRPRRLVIGIRIVRIICKLAIAPSHG